MMAKTLTDTLLPIAHYRQWVFTYPVPLRLRMARDPKLLTAVLQRSRAENLERDLQASEGFLMPMRQALCGWGC